MVSNGTILGTERTENYACKNCDFFTSHYGHWKRHLETKKHLKSQMVPSCPKTKPLFRCSCKKTYKYRQGYYRHKKTCNFPDHDTKTLHDCIKAMTKAMSKMSNKSTTITNIHTYNNTNIMVYLNEKFSNALSIQDFIDRLTLTLSDLDNLKQDKPRAIASIVRQNLAPLTMFNRPMHNINNKDWYIKDKLDGWQEDTGEKLVKNVELGILKNWTRVYKRTYPEWFKADKTQNEFIELTNLTTSEIEPKTFKKIIKFLRQDTFLSSIE